MLKKLFIIISCMTAMGTLSADQPKTSNASTAIVSELFGYSIGKSLKSQGTPFDRDAVIRGIINGSEGGPLPTQECAGVLDTVQEEDLVKMKEKVMKTWKKMSKAS